MWGKNEEHVDLNDIKELEQQRQTLISQRSEYHKAIQRCKERQPWFNLNGDEILHQFFQTFANDEPNPNVVQNRKHLAVKAHY